MHQKCTQRYGKGGRRCQDDTPKSIIVPYFDDQLVSSGKFFPVFPLNGPFLFSPIVALNPFIRGNLNDCWFKESAYSKQDIGQIIESKK